MWLQGDFSSAEHPLPVSLSPSPPLLPLPSLSSRRQEKHNVETGPIFFLCLRVAKVGKGDMTVPLERRQAQARTTTWSPISCETDTVIDSAGAPAQHPGIFPLAGVTVLQGQAGGGCKSPCSGHSMPTSGRRIQV